MRPLGDDWWRCTPQTLTEHGGRPVRCKHTAKPERPKRKGKR
jgi:hypothetical protein